MALRLIFMGTPDFAVPALAEIAARGHDIAAVYTRAAKPAGRDMDVQASPVERAARSLALPVLTPATLKDESARAEFAAHRADAAVVIAYGLILPKAVLDAPRLGCFNLHASLLPRWRGAAPINRAIMAGDAETGVTVMKMDEGLDTGKVAKRKVVKIDADMTAGQLHDILAATGAKLMLKALDALERRTIRYKKQANAGIIKAAKIDKAETRIDWAKPWGDVHNHIRGLSPFPGAWFELGGARVKALRSAPGEGQNTLNVAPGTVLDDKLTVACGEGSVRLTQVQRAGKQPMNAEDFLRGTAVTKGSVLA